MGSIDDIASVLYVWSERHGIAAAVQEILPAHGDPDPDLRAEFSPAELRLLGSHRHPGRRASWVAGRLAARRAVRSWCRRRGQAVEAIQVLRRESGEPRLVEHPELHVSISHAGDLAVAVVCDRPLGVDLEGLEARPDALVEFFFSASERDWIRRVPSETSLRCNLLWTRKEAVSKLLGTGGELLFPRLAVLDEERPWAIDSASTPSHAISLAMDRI